MPFRRFAQVCAVWLISCSIGFCMPSGQDAKSPSLAGSAQEAAVEIGYNEAAAHRLGDAPALRLDDRQARQWRYDDFEYKLQVSPSGDVVAAQLTSNTPPEMPAAFVSQAEEEIHALRFRPFEREGRPVWAAVTEYVRILPQEKLPLTYVPFPAIGDSRADREKVVMMLERTVCYGRCPAYSLRIYGDGRVEYEGQSFVAEKGRHTGSIDQEKVDALLALFRKADFFSLDQEYRYGVTDNPTYTLSFTTHGRSKRVVDYVGEMAGMPASVTQLEQAMDAAANADQWITGHGTDAAPAR